MNKRLAIKGHSTRGQEVIEILEMLGGKNYYHMDGFTEDSIYYICKDENNQIHSAICPTNQIVFTIEEFLKKYPYKIGDKVDYIKYDDEECSVYEIVGMMWTGATIEYTLDSFGFTCLTKDIRLHKENNMNKNKIFKSLNVETYLKVWDETENGLEVCVAEGYEMIEKNGQFYIVKQKTKYPSDYDECCEVLNTHLSNVTRPIGWKENLISKFQELIICRDAYWKIAGDEYQLGKPWEPDWTNNYQKKWIINFYQGEINLTTGSNAHFLLAFPTEEMRDIFYENFKKLIEQCREFL